MDLNGVNLINSLTNVPKNTAFREKPNKKGSIETKGAPENNLPGAKFYSSLPFKGKTPEISRSEILNTIRTKEPFSKAGFKGDVYKLEKGGKAYAIKVAKTEADFSKEAEILKRVPKGTGQEFVDYFKDPVTGFDILVSTFADGKTGVLEGEEDFKTFFDNLLFLDRAEILHGDLNMANCLFDGGKINLIDFGEGSIIKTGDGYEEMYPPFMLKTNAINLEQNGIPDCLQSWNKRGLDTKEIFKSYLRAKGEFYKNHIEYLIESGVKDKDAIRFEENLGKVLTNPSQRVIENELRRMDTLYTFESADTAINYVKSPKGAIRNWNITVQKAENMLFEIKKSLALPDLSPEERTYFEYQKQIAGRLLFDYKDWSKSTIEWIKGSFKKPLDELSDHEKAFIENRDVTMELPCDLYSMVFEG